MTFIYGLDIDQLPSRDHRVIGTVAMEFIDQFNAEVLRQSTEVVNFYTCLRGDGFYTCYDRFDSLTGAWALVTFFAIYRYA